MTHEEFQPAEDPKDSQEFSVIGLGGSAGGSEAFEEFFSQLPPKSGCAFVMVMHLDPHHKSMLPELISKVTDLDVTQAEDAMEVERNRIYIIPPNATITISGGVLNPYRTRAGKKRQTTHRRFFSDRSPKTAKNGRWEFCFREPARTRTQGLKEIKFAGGMSMVQDPSTAKFENMPQHAITSGVGRRGAAGRTTRRASGRISREARGDSVLKNPRTNRPGRKTLRSFWMKFMSAPAVTYRATKEQP